MIFKLLIPLIPILVMLLGFAPMAAVVYWWGRNNRRKCQSPLTRDLLRPPGHSLRQRIEELDSKIELHLLGVFLIPLLL